MALTDIDAQRLGDSVGDKLGNRSLIINGGMKIAQRGTSQTSVSDGSNDGFNTIDRFGIEFGNSAGGVCTISRNSTVPSGYGFSNSYKVDVTTADTSIADDHLIYIRQGIEAQNVRNCGWDYTNTSSFITVSFWARSSKAGNYCCTLRAQDVGHFYYNHTYSLVANTWKKITFSVPGNASLVLNDDNGLGIDLRWNLAIAANRNDATTNSWQTGSEFSSTEIVNFFDSTSNDFYLTGVQLENGNTATSFEHRSYGDDLAGCQRYYSESNGAGGCLEIGTAIISSRVAGPVKFMVPMVATPTVIIYSTDLTAGKINLYNSSGVNLGSGFVAENVTAAGYRYVGDGSGLTGGNFYSWKWTADAEL
jgi:hypothetical protein